MATAPVSLVRCRGPALPARLGSGTRALRRPSVGLRIAASAAQGAAAAPPPSTPTRQLSETDRYMEDTRKLMRSVFEPDRWELHRSPSRYFRHLFGIGGSRLVTGLAQPLLYIAGVAASVCLYGWAFSQGMLPPGLPSPSVFAGSKEFFGMTSFALALLLVFRTNASYARWDEARKFFGLVLNRSREMTRLGLIWISEEKRELREMLGRWVPAYSRALMCHLRKGEDLAKELEGILLPHEIEALCKAVHRPNYVIQVLGHIVKSAEVPQAVQLRMEDHLTAYADCLGGCERLLRTPIPLFYTRHTSRFLMIWATLLPFALWPACGLATLPLAIIIAFLLLGIDKIGVSIEEPHSILAYEAICGTILASVRELQAVDAAVGAAVSEAAAAPAPDALVTAGADGGNGVASRPGRR